MSLNRCDFIGEPFAIKYFTDQFGFPVTRFSLLVKSNYRDKNNKKSVGEEVIKCVSFGPLADVCKKMVPISKRVYASGRYHGVSYYAGETKDVYVKSAEIVIEKFVSLDFKLASEKDTIQDNIGNKHDEDY